NAALKPPAPIDPAKPVDPGKAPEAGKPVGTSVVAVSSPTPPFPGPIPPDLLAAAGDPPAFAAAVAPLLTTVSFDDGETLTYPSHIALPKAFAYYRFPQGTVAYGPRLTDLPQAEVDALFKVAGMTESEQRIAFAVSKLEGGFESVNTYDTG